MGSARSTTSSAGLVGLVRDMLKRMYDKDPSLGFTIEEGGNLISHQYSIDRMGTMGC